MILYEIFGDEDHPVYQELATTNGLRQYDFLQSMVLAAIGARKGFLSQQLLKALNYQAIVCLHTTPGEYRPCPVFVGAPGQANDPNAFHPPEHYRVQALMDDLVNDVNSNWSTSNPVELAAFVLWRLNNIHPFINGNGRTARAACYFVLCLRAGGLLPGTVILPELLKQNRDEYVNALRDADRGNRAPLTALIARLLEEQLRTAEIAPAARAEDDHIEPPPPVPQDAHLNGQHPPS